MTDRGRRRRPPAARAARIGVAGASVAGFATLLAAMPLTADAGGTEQAADPVTRLDWSPPTTAAPSPQQPRRVVRIIVRRHVVTNAPTQRSRGTSRALPSPPAAPAPVAAAPASPPPAPSATAHRPAPARTHGS